MWNFFFNQKTGTSAHLLALLHTSYLWWWSKHPSLSRVWISYCFFCFKNKKLKTHFTFCNYVKLAYVFICIKATFFCVPQTKISDAIMTHTTTQGEVSGPCVLYHIQPFNFTAHRWVGKWLSLQSLPILFVPSRMLMKCLLRWSNLLHEKYRSKNVLEMQYSSKAEIPLLMQFSSAAQLMPKNCPDAHQSSY